MIFHDGKGTSQVLMPKDSATGWKNKIYGGTGVTVNPVNEQINQINGVLTAGPSTVKWEKRTPFVHSHCSSGVGTLLGCNFHLRKYGIASMIIHGTQRPK